MLSSLHRFSKIYKQTLSMIIVYLYVSYSFNLGHQQCPDL